MHCGKNLIGLVLESRGMEYGFSSERFLDILESLGTLESLKQLSIHLWKLFEREKEEMVVPLSQDGFLQDSIASATAAWVSDEILQIFPI